MAQMTTQSLAPPGRAAAGQLPRQCIPARVAAPVAQAGRRRRGRSQAQCLVVATFDEFSGTSPSAMGLLTQAASLMAVAAGAWYAARLASQQVIGTWPLTWL